MIFECLIHNFPKLTTLPTVQGATSASAAASSSNGARNSKSPPVRAPAARGGKAPAITPAVPAARGGKAPATTPAVPASAGKGRKAPATTPTAPTAPVAAPAPPAKGAKATGQNTVPAAAPAPTPIPVPAPAPAPAPAETDSTKCCFFNTFKSDWQPNLPLFVCDGDPSGLRPCLSGKILNDTYDMR